MNKHLSICLVVLMSCSLGEYEVGPLPPQLECAPSDEQDCETYYPGICSVGRQHCLQTGQFGACSAISLPGTMPELCDGLDNNCNGEIDEGFFWKDPNTSLNIKVGQKCCTGKGVCCGSDEVVVCSGTNAVCAGNAILPSDAWHDVAENGSFDWNCNGMIEFGIVGQNYTYECVVDCAEVLNEKKCKLAMQYKRCASVKVCGSNNVGDYSYACEWDASNKLCKYGSSSVYNPKVVCK